jgi:tetratricopeptide (TPR) repeat protein
MNRSARNWALALLLAASAARVSAQAPRVVVVAKGERDGRAVEVSELEGAALQALATKGVRVVELDASLRAQRHAFAERLQQDSVPHELTVLNADAALSLRLACDKSAGAVLGSKLVAYHCVITGKLVRLDTGDVVWSDRNELSGHGLTAAMAVQSVFKTRVPQLLRAQTDAWLARLSAAELWSVDLVVNGLSDRTTAEAVRVRLDELPEIDEARLVLWNRGSAKYALRGRGGLALEQLASALDRDPALALTVTYHAERSLHADYDFAKAYRRRVMVMSVTSLSADNEELGAQVVSAALLNLPYFEIAHSRPLLATPAEQSELSARLRDKARELKVPLMLVCSFTPRADAWSAGVRLLHVESGREIAAGSAQGAGVAEAIDGAVRVFDVRFRSAQTRASTRVRFGLESAAVERLSASGLTIHAFRVPTHGGNAGGAGHPNGTLELHNESQDAIEDVHIKVDAAGKRVFEQPLPSLPPGARVLVPVPLAGIAIGDDGYVAIGATLSYRRGERRGIASAFAALIAAPSPSQTEPGGGQVAQPERSTEAPDGLLHAGLVHALAGRWAQARSALLQAHTLAPSAQTLRALGLVELDLGQRAAAAELLRRALGERVDPLTDQQREEVSALLSRL